MYERGVHVRPPRPGDKEVLAELIYRFYMLNEEFDPLWTLKDDAKEAAAAEAEKIVAGGGGEIVLVAQVAEEVVGYIRGYIREMPLLANGRMAVVKEIYVKPQARRLGLGSLLLERFSEEARRLGARAVAGEFPAQNAIAHRFYERLGFRSFMYTMIKEV
ncbi:putative acetyltransferase [Aeropyrum pernix K1]|uniref:Acetyltransferase n=2 Tax=Aeropyrum pernix TaxID=56636 RepID=Q9YF51_AERPE|nr:GNAT family N-acetyltransferase [Aeropyrum pernix]BAA79345.1 putative acetyltransferase [Aeropyrum pernix K1]GBF09340.1 putative acetyltransferase [Aeropyrum pernix]